MVLFESFALIIMGGYSKTDRNEDKVVKEILDKCKKKNIRVHFILKFNSGIYKEMDYFVAPPIEDVGGERVGCRNGYSYKSNSILKRIKKDSLGSGMLLENDGEFVEVYRDKNFD